MKRLEWTELRLAAGYRSDLALEMALRVSPGSIWRWRTGRSKPRRVAVERVLDALQISQNELNRLFKTKGETKIG